MPSRQQFRTIATSIKTKVLLSVTAKAARQIKKMLKEQDASGIRVLVKSRGCSGLSYGLEYAKEPQKGDEVVETQGIKLFVDPKATFFVIGSQMDYSEGELEYGFTFSNPNEKGRCGCGESFHV